MKNFNDSIGNRTRDLPACSAVLQPTAPPRTPSCLEGMGKITIKPHNSRCPDRDVKDTPLEYKCENNTASASFALKGYLKKRLQISISLNPIKFLAFSGG